MPNTNHQNLHILKASAGSGKTFTLARQYIDNLLWEHDETGKGQFRKEAEYHRHILAITFTNKATDEMKKRIIDELFLLSLQKGNHIDFFAKKYGNTKEEIAQAAQRALNEILFNYSTFHVSTIDSFFQQVLRTFAHELDQEYNYELELDEKLALRIAVHNFMLTLGGKKQNPNVNKWVTDHIIKESRKGGNWDFLGAASETTISKFAEQLNTEIFRKYHKETMNYLSDIGYGYGTSNIMKFMQKLVEARKERIRQWENNELHSPQEFIEVLSSIGLNVDDLPPKSTWRNLLVPTRKYDENDKKPYKSLHDMTIDTLANAKKGPFKDLGLDDLQKLIDYLDQVLRDYDRIGALAKITESIWLLGLLGQINEQLDLYRKENSAILIADTNDLIGKVIESGVPFMYERMGTWLHTFMLDEFQDTSMKQYDNFLPLLDNSLSDYHPNLIIGDEKQSIYRFRNSNPDLLQYKVEKDLSDYVCRTDKPLTVNWRSLPLIIDFNNALFDKILDYFKVNQPQYTKLADTYKNIKQEQSGKYDKCPTQGFVKVNFIYKNSDFAIQDEDNKPLAGEEQMLHYLPQYINEIRGRGYEYRDILILVNTNQDGDKIVKCLLEHNSKLPANDPKRIEIMSKELLMLSNSSSVRLIISVLRFIDSTVYFPNEENSDDVNATEDATTRNQKSNFIKARRKEQKLYRALHRFEEFTANADKEDDLGEQLVKSFENDNEDDNEELIENYSKELNDILNATQAQQLNLVTLIENIIKSFLLGKGNKSYAQEETIFLLALQNYVLQFCQRQNGATVHEFLRYWDLYKDHLTVTSPSDANAVNIMTIHAAKGLEAPCVIIPFANWDLIREDNVNWVTREYWMKGNGSGAPIEGIDDEEIVPPLIPIEKKVLELLPEFKSLYDNNQQESLIDIINKTYVALTRPKQEMHIFAFKPAPCETPEVKTVGDLLYNFVPKIDGIKIQNDKDDNGNEFIRSCTVGNTKETKLAESNDEEEQIVEEQMPPYTVENYPEQLKVSIPLFPDAKRDAGITMHNFLSQINNIDDANALLEQWVTKGLITTNPDDKWNKEQVEKLIDNIRENQTLATWFSPYNTVYNERTITSRMPTNTNIDLRDEKAMRRLPDASVVENRRPDRIVVTPDGKVIVIDYKFGAQRPQHKWQVKRYIAMLKECGLENIEGDLWYVSESAIVAV